jgi:hypothetical protein
MCLNPPIVIFLSLLYYRVREAMVPTVKRLGGYVVQQKSLSSATKSSSNATPEVTTVTVTPGRLAQPQQQPYLEYTNHAVIPSTTDLTNISLEEILDVVTGGHVATCGPLNALCQEANFYQLWTKEYIEHLGDYLLDRAARSTVRSQAEGGGHSNHKGRGDDDDDNSKNLLVLDIGAGDGLLIRCLQEYMTRKLGSTEEGDTARRIRKGQKSTMSDAHRSMPTLVATDDMSWGIFAKATVEKLSVQQALQKYVPLSVNKDGDTDGREGQNMTQRRQRAVVLCSWMPMGLDWTALFRDCGVEEYILIGEADDGSCGHNWKTWGNPAFFDSQEEDNLHDNASRDGGNGVPVPPYEMDGYERWDMHALSQFQFSSFDCSVSKSSKTVSFRKRRRTKPRRAVSSVP